MGSVFSGGTFEYYNWHDGIRRVQEEDERRYGYEYSGASNCCDFLYGGDKSKLTKKQIEEYRENMKNMLESGSGVVIQTGIKGYELWTTEYKEMNFEDKTRRSYFDSREFLCCFNPKSTTIIVSSSDRIIASGTMSEMKKEAHKLLRECNYSERYYIISRNSKCYRCRGVCKTVSKTTRETTNNVLVLPINKYMYMGWFRE